MLSCGGQLSSRQHVRSECAGASRDVKKTILPGPSNLPAVIMDSVEPLVAAVTPFIQDAMASNAVTSIITSCQQPRAALGDNKVIWLIGGIAVGFYFGFRVGVVSGRW